MLLRELYLSVANILALSLVLKLKRLSIKYISNALKQKFIFELPKKSNAKMTDSLFS